MKLSVECPKCGKSYQVAEERVGSQARCSGCSHTFTLEMSVDETALPKAKPAPKTPDVEASRKPSGTSGSSQPGSGSGEPSSARSVRQIPPPPPGGSRSKSRQSGLLRAKPLETSSPRAVAQSAETAPPERVGHYVIKKKLGAGAMGEVYLAYDPNLDRQVAIKMLPPELAQDRGRWRRFLREARSAAKLHHSNVATVYLAGKADDRAFMAMELVDGGSLDEALAREGPMDWREATRAIRDAAAGLAAAHKIGLVHRDIKPANLMQTAEGVTKVVDFGLARARAEDTQLTRDGAILGTPAYMSPEQWKGKELDGRSDVYSLICTYYALLTGIPPFDAAALGALGYLHCHEPFPDPREIAGKLPDGACRVLVRGSAKDAGQRYQDAAELVAELDALLASPDDSLTSTCSWQALIAASAVNKAPMGPPSPASVPSDRLPVDVSPISRTARGEAVREGGVARSIGDTTDRLLRRAFGWLRTPAGLAASAAAGLITLLLGIVIYVSTNYGTVKIELSDPAPDVQVRVDGDSVGIAGREQPLKLKVGEHDLLVTSAGFETYSKSFTVKRGQEDVLRVSLVPKPKPPPAQLTVDVSGLDKQVTIDLGSGVTMELVLIPAGSFMMGSPDFEPDARDDEKPLHKVTITKPFYLGRYEVTQEQWQAVVGTNPSMFPGPKNPVDSVNWGDCQAFITKLNERLVNNGARFTLPTEAQWEYACRAGTTTRYSFGNDKAMLDGYAWIARNSHGRTHPVGQKESNAWGLYDIHGNVWEWCADWYRKDYYRQCLGNDPTGPLSGPWHVMRGGSRNNLPSYVGSAYRAGYPPANRHGDHGFRVAMTVGELQTGGSLEKSSPPSHPTLPGPPSDGEHTAPRAEPADNTPENGTSPPPADGSIPSSKIKIDKTLDLVTEMEFYDMPLLDVVEMLKMQYEIEIHPAFEARILAPLWEMGTHLPG